MAAGEYVSISSQSDSEDTNLRRERRELTENPRVSLKELADINFKRGLDRTLALQVDKQFMDRDAIEAHARDELGISEANSARPVQAALLSAASFSVGGSFHSSWGCAAMAAGNNVFFFMNGQRKTEGDQRNQSRYDQRLHWSLLTALCRAELLLGL